jgi:hypothetical protein
MSAIVGISIAFLVRLQELNPSLVEAAASPPVLIANIP